MATIFRVGNAALRSSFKSARFPATSMASSSLRHYSSTKTQVSFTTSSMRYSDPLTFPQTLKETFAQKIPGEIEKIKKLRKLVDNVERPPNNVNKSL